jgi:mRNA-degrading endonuclease YafQ of YafQ-DinJ toxin-antitoxin module
MSFEIEFSNQFKKDVKLCKKEILKFHCWNQF